MPPRSIKAETRAAVLCGLLGANVDPELSFWIFRVVDVLSCALAALAVYFVLLLLLDLAAEGVGAFRARAAAAFQRHERPSRHPHSGAAA